MKKYELIALSLTLALLGVLMLYFSSISEMVDEEYFRQLAVAPWNIATPLWQYSPVPALLVHPIAALTTNPFLLRIPTILLSLATMLLFYLVARKHVGLYALASIVPIVITSRLLKGAMWFYWDTFLMFFFALTLYLLESNKPKWAVYLSATMLSVSKMWLGPIFLLPLVLKERKLIFCALAYLPIYYAPQLVLPPALVPTISTPNNLAYAIATGSPAIFSSTSWWLTHFATDFLLYLLSTLGCLVVWRQHPTGIAFYLLTIAYSIVSGFGFSHTSTIIYGGILACPLATYNLLSKEVSKVVRQIKTQDFKGAPNARSST